MAHRIEISTKVNDTRSQVMTKKLQTLGFKVEDAKVIEVYTINLELTPDQSEQVAQILSNPVSQTYKVDDFFPGENISFALEIGFLPGVTDNIGNTAKETIEEFLKSPFEANKSVHTSTLILLTGPLTEEDSQNIGNSLANPLIQSIKIKPAKIYADEKGMGIKIPEVHLKSHPQADEVDLNISDEELTKLSRDGIPNEDGTRRGPLALEPAYLQAIKDYYARQGRNPTDIELESIAQTWSEHCKHTIFAASIDEDLPEGLYKGYIKRATQEIRKQKGNKDICVSVFSDNSGGIIFDENWVITDKAETHNSPSALDPFGGAVTGIVGVNRDCIGYGKGAKPVINKYGYCVGFPEDTEPLYRDPQLTNKLLPPRRILNGIVDGVNQGGNCSGIPTPQGFVYFNDRYKGKPLVFVGTVGLIPRKINDQPSEEKQAQPGDKIVVLGGRVGQDGIHGATFSSEALSSGSPATAVQIGDPITQKKLSDAIVKEARDQELYNSITDCGAGGISCSVAEMAKECGGCTVELDQVPLKYPNLEPWKIWISESQERMTLAVPPEKLAKFTELMKSRGVEATVIGEFTDSGHCKVNYNGSSIMDLEMDFLHDGLPDKHLETTYTKQKHEEPNFTEPQDLTESLHLMLAHHNNASFEYISKQYDHNVQGSECLGPLQGKGKVNANTSVTKPLLDSPKGVVCSQALYPLYSDIDTYHMAACSIDGAIRNAIAIGGNLDHLAIMDNFCWCSSNEEERLGQLKAAAKACYDYAVAFGTPYISGKDSMFNDFKGFNAKGEPTQISIPPTLLISSIGVINDATKAISLSPKFPGDLVYILGETNPEELGGSEYFAMHGFIGNNIPKVDAAHARELYQLYSQAAENRMISSALSPSFGGLITALTKKAIAGQFGMELQIPQTSRADYYLYSESASRIIVSIDPKHQQEFENHFANRFTYLGKTTESQNFIIKNANGETIIQTTVPELNEQYRKYLKDF